MYVSVRSVITNDGLTRTVTLNPGSPESYTGQLHWKLAGLDSEAPVWAGAACADPVSGSESCRGVCCPRSCD